MTKTKNSDMIEKVETALTELEKVYAHLGYNVESPYDDVYVLQQLSGLVYELNDD